jgi:hypothetical protein
MRASKLWLLALLLAACNDTFEKQQQVRRVRVLAVKAEPAEIVVPSGGGAPAPVQFTSLAVAPDTRRIDVRLALCRPGNPFSGDFRCPGADGFDLDGGVLDLSDPAVRAFLLAGFDGGGAGQQTPGASAGAALSLFVGYTADDGSGTPEGQERGIRAVPLRQGGTANRNPRIDTVQATIDGGPGSELSLDALPANQRVLLVPALQDGSIEQYSDGTALRTETITYSWYATGDGGVVDLRTREPVEGIGEPRSAFDVPAAGSQLRLWLVARDERGGVDFTERDLVVK